MEPSESLKRAATNAISEGLPSFQYGGVVYHIAKELPSRFSTFFELGEYVVYSLKDSLPGLMAASIPSARNIEIKAHLPDLRETLRSISEIAGFAPELELWHEDTFFRCDIDNGRLKLRHEDGDNRASELIFYVREDDTPDPKVSKYSRCPVSSPDQLKNVLGAALGIIGRVVKHRYVHRIGNARVHVDEVLGLAGCFLEIEVVLGEADSVESGYATMSSLMARLGIDSNQLVAKAYLDLLVEVGRTDG